MKPIGVVIPRDRDDVIAALDAARRHQAPVLPRGEEPAWRDRLSGGPSSSIFPST